MKSENLNSLEVNFVSVIVYVYNDQKYVQKFITQIVAILSNNFLKFEIIVVNDNSTDDSIKLLREYVTANCSEINIKVLNMSYHQGLESSMNAGLNLSIGDFVFEFDTVLIDYTWSNVLEVYNTSLSGYDIVNASSKQKPKFSSYFFYTIFNRYANLQFNLGTETFRVLSRRAINTVFSISKTIPYRKAIYANCGLKLTTIKYIPIKKIKEVKLENRISLAINSIILFSDLAYKFTLFMAFFMIFATFFVAVYAFIFYLYGNPVEGWTTTILFLSFAFFGLFLIMAIIIKYLSTIVNLLFSKKEYLFESIEKL